MKPPRVFIGIDPGKSGGIATLAEDSEETDRMPDTFDELWDCFRHYSDRADILVYMEQVGGFIGTRTADDGGVGDGKKRNLASGHSMFAFGKQVGHVEMAVYASKLWKYLTLVPPRKWQAEFGITPKAKGETQSQFKRRIKEVAQGLFPDLTVTLNTADALLIALYGKRTYERT